MNKKIAPHFQSCQMSFRELKRQPMASLLTIAVIGIALALPLILWLALQNLQIVSLGWHDSAQITLFLKQELSAQSLQQLESDLNAMPQVAAIRYISPDEGLQSFKQHSGFGDVLNALAQNPLPGVIIVQPKMSQQTPEALDRLMQALKQRPEVDVAQLDFAWVKRLYALLGLAKRCVMALAVLLAVGVLLIVGNTIRLALQNQKRVIEIYKLVGATDAFVRRPFLYSGFWYGLGGALAAAITVELMVLWLQPTVQHLSLLYDSQFRLSGLSVGVFLCLLLLGIALGSCGAWLAIRQHLRHTNH